MSGFFDMGEDSIERWHQIRMRRHARIRSLRSAQRQKNSQAKHKNAHNNVTMKDFITKFNDATRRNLRRDKN